MATRPSPTTSNTTLNINQINEYHPTITLHNFHLRPQLMSYSNRSLIAQMMTYMVFCMLENIFQAFFQSKIVGTISAIKPAALLQNSYIKVACMYLSKYAHYGRKRFFPNLKKGFFSVFWKIFTNLLHCCKKHTYII